jgi:hypothetical protein
MLPNILLTYQYSTSRIDYMDLTIAKCGMHG